MKFLIWFICLTSAALLMTFIEQGAGLMLPPIIKMLISGAAITIAIILCKKLKKKKNENKDENNAENNDEDNDEDNDDNSSLLDETREERWRIQAEKDEFVLARNDKTILQIKSAITLCNAAWDIDTTPELSSRSTKERSLNYLRWLTPELFLLNYYVFKSGNRDDIKDKIYTERPYLVLETLINMGLFIFETKNNIVVLKEIIDSCDEEFKFSKPLAQKILNEELNDNEN